MVSPLVLLAIQETPAIIGRLQDLFRQRHPAAVPPTSDEVIAAYNQAFTSSLARDLAWLSQHPE